MGYELITRSGPDLLQAPVRYDEPSGRAAQRKRHTLYLFFTVIVSAVVLFGLLEALTRTPGYGIDSGTVHASGNGTSLTVRYAHATRGQLVSPFEVTVRREGGFDGPVTVAVSRDYLDLFISNGVSPAAASETSSADAVYLTFDPPPTGDTMSVAWDVVAKPTPFFITRHGFVSVVDSTGASDLTARFETRVHA